MLPPLVAPVSNLVTLAISSVILLVALPVVGQGLSLRFLLVIPAMVLLFVFTAAVGLVLSRSTCTSANVKFMVRRYCSYGCM